MSWKEVLKAHCGTERMDTEDDDEEFGKTLVGNQKRLDKDKDGKITGKDFKMLRDEKKAVKSDSDIEKEILAEIKKEGGALGMKNLKPICPPKDLKRVLDAMKRKKVIFMHSDGDIYTHKPKR
jgi:hypothetical protein